MKGETVPGVVARLIILREARQLGQAESLIGSEEILKQGTVPSFRPRLVTANRSNLAKMTLTRGA